MNNAYFSNIPHKQNTAAVVFPVYPVAFVEDAIVLHFHYPIQGVNAIENIELLLPMQWDSVVQNMIWAPRINYIIG